MAGTKVNNYAIGDSDIEAVMLTTDQIYKGQCQVSLTEMSTTIVPKIAAGSWVEVNGTLFKFDTDETLTGSPSDGIVYIRIVPSTTTCTAEMTNTAPTWSDSKQGWYGTGGAANYRYIPFWLNKSSSVYIKQKYKPGSTFINDYTLVAKINGGIVSPAGSYFYNYTPTIIPEFDLKNEVSGGVITIKESGFYSFHMSGWMGTDTTHYMFLSRIKIIINSDVNHPYSENIFKPIYTGGSPVEITLDCSKQQHSINFIKQLTEGDIITISFSYTYGFPGMVISPVLEWGEMHLFLHKVN